MPDRRLHALLILLACAALLPLRPARAGIENPTESYRDPVHKFSFKVFRDWQQVPIEAGEEIEVAKFMEDSNRGAWVTPSLLVVRVDKREGGGQPVVTGEGNDALRRLLEGQKPKSAWEATLGRLRLPPESLPSQDSFKEVRSKDKIDGKLYVFEMPFPGYGPDGPPVFFALITFEKDSIEYGIFFQSLANRRKNYEKGLERLAKTFRFFDEKAKDVETLDVLDGVNITAERRREIERGMVKGWDVVVSSKKNYIVIYNTVNDRNHQLAKEIARRIELIREQIYEVQFPPAKPITAVSIVRVCGDREEYFEYGGPGGSAGYWNSRAEELVFYDASRSKKIDDNTVSVLYHEAFHQYIYYSAGDVAPHSWFNEGHGDYYAGAELKGSKFTIEPFRWRQGIIKNAVAKGPREKVEVEGPGGKKVEQYANDGGYTPLKDLVRFTQGQYYSYPSISYAQGWSLIYFLREIVPQNKSYREKWGRILDVYFDTLKAAVAGEPVAAGGDDAKDGAKDDDEDPVPAPDTPGDEDGGDGEGEDPSTWIPPQFLGGRGGAQALEKAVSAAFENVDFDELEAAWTKAVKKDM